MKTLKVKALVLAVLLVSATPAFAYEGPPQLTSPILSGAGIGVGIGVALTMLGAGLGFGKIGSSALESMARQPEVADRIRGTMIVVAALLEGATFFALLICLILATSASF